MKQSCYFEQQQSHQSLDGTNPTDPEEKRHCSHEIKTSKEEGKKEKKEGAGTTAVEERQERDF